MPPRAGTRERARRVAVALACGLALLGSADAAAARGPQPRHVAARHVAHRPARAHGAIVGGTAAAQGQWPWLAFVYDQTSSSSGFSCSGTVIAPNLVLTAGHCGEDDTGTTYDPGGYVVVTGAADWTDTSTRQLSAVARVIPSPSYDPSTGFGDAALLELATPTSAPTVPLAGAGDLGLLAAGHASVIAGWGLTDGAASDAPTALQWAQTAVQSASYCGAQASIAGIPYDASWQACTIDPPSFSTSICHGDSGGPLLAQRGNGTWVETGISSEVMDPGCNPDAPSVFTRADTISAWAAGWAAALAPSPSPPTSPPPPASTPPSTQPTPSSAAPPAIPVAGTYRGRTSQRAAIALRTTRDGNGASVAALSFGFTLRCRVHHRRLSYRISPVDSRNPWPIVDSAGRGFSDWFRDTDGARYHVVGTFTGTALAHGTVHVVWHTRRYGACDSGSVRWSVTRR